MKYTIRDKKNNNSIICNAVGVENEWLSNKWSTQKHKIIKQRHVSLQRKTFLLCQRIHERFHPNYIPATTNTTTTTTITNAIQQHELNTMVTDLTINFIVQMVEATCNKKCIGLSNEDKLFIQEHALSNEEFKQNVKTNPCTIQIYYFPKTKNEILLTNDLIGIIYKSASNSSQVTCYFSSIVDMDTEVTIMNFNRCDVGIIDNSSNNSIVGNAEATIL